jgi:hypothetical protein
MRPATKHPSGIPSKVIRDTVLIKAMNTRRNLLERFAFLKHRVNPYNPKRSRIEKRRTKERRDVSDQLRAVERDIMRWLGEHARHPDVYTPRHVDRTKDPLDPNTFSRYDQLKRRWREARQASGSSLNKLYRRQLVGSRTKMRHKIAQDIQDLEWKWMAALHDRLFPDTPQPPRRQIHPSRFKP